MCEVKVARYRAHAIEDFDRIESAPNTSIKNKTEIITKKNQILKLITNDDKCQQPSDLTRFFFPFFLWDVKV